MRDGLVVESRKDVVHVSVQLSENEQKVKTAKQFLEQNPTGFVEAAVKGMLPHNTLGRKQGMKLFVYAGDKHPHAAQNPVEMKVKG